jgi:tRNA/tmRNA/rRNA uracil-C5-methylase (TrmA/RlmC/RlmD family)
VSFQPGDLIEVTAEAVAQGGWCVSRPPDDRVVFVRHALPGERVVARVTEVTSKFARADAVDILDASPDRVEPPCPNARPGGCGGCDWQHASLPAQRALKAAVVREQLHRLAGTDREVTVEPLPGDDHGTAYGQGTGSGQGNAGGADDNTGLGWRTRMQFAVDDEGVAGLRAHRSHEVIDIGDCPIAHPGIRDLGIPRRRWTGAIAVEAAVASSPSPSPTPSPADAEAQGPAVFAGPPGEGVTGGLPPVPGGRQGGRPPGEIQGRPPGETQGRPSGEIQREVIVVSVSRPAEVPDVGAESVLSRYGRKLAPVRGRSYLTQWAAGREWRVSAGAFWQVHPAAADTLTAAVLAALEPKPGDSALDLYCGAGLFAGSLAAAVGPGGTVAAVESDEAAVRDARYNLRDFPWATVHRGDVGAVLRSASSRGGGSRGGGPRGAGSRGAGSRSAGSRRAALPLARLVVADPPRSGLDRAIIGYLSAASSGAERFCYVSCDPATLARDVGLLQERGWALEGLRAFDAFPMTHHVECVAWLVR